MPGGGIQERPRTRHHSRLGGGVPCVGSTNSTETAISSLIVLCFTVRIYLPIRRTRMLPATTVIHRKGELREHDRE